MAEKRLDGYTVACLATDGFEWAELAEPRKAFEEAGAKVVIIAPHSGEIYGMKHHDKAGTVKVDRTLDQVSEKDFDAVLLPGGALNADALRIEKKAQEFVRQANQHGKPIAVICHGPWLLISAGLVKGHTITSWPSVQDDIRNAGGTWVDKQVQRDGSWVSSRKPDDLPAFNREAIDVFAETAKQGIKAA